MRVLPPPPLPQPLPLGQLPHPLSAPPLQGQSPAETLRRGIPAVFVQPAGRLLPCRKLHSIDGLCQCYDLLGQSFCRKSPSVFFFQAADMVDRRSIRLFMLPLVMSAASPLFRRIFVMLDTGSLTQHSLAVRPALETNTRQESLLHATTAGLAYKTYALRAFSSLSDSMISALPYCMVLCVLIFRRYSLGPSSWS